MVALAAVMSLASNCTDPPEPPVPPEPEQEVIFDNAYEFDAGGGTVTINVTMAESWKVAITGGGSWCTVNKKSGPAGDITLIIEVKENTSTEPRSCEATLASKTELGKMKFSQEQKDVLSVDPDHYDVPAEGGVFTPVITANVGYIVMVSDEWLQWADGTLTVSPNEAEEARTATVSLIGMDLTCQITVTQVGIGDVPSEPHDELDGIVTELKTHTVGGGVPVVIMGDAFSHEQIEGGTFASLAGIAVEALFSIEPFTTFENLFDVYTVTVVSHYWDNFYTPGSTTLGSYFGAGSYVTGNHDKCLEYALKAIPEDKVDDALVIILMNREYHAGRCWMQLVRKDGEVEETDDCARGIAYAYMALGTDEDDFVGLVRHEAGGHGIGRLADEYFYEGTGPITQETIDDYKSYQRIFHVYRNVDFTSDPEEVLWARFLADERYKNDGVGLFEGAATWEQGAWRPSESSIMLSNEGTFNAPSREEIYFRIHKIAYGADWEYDYEAFAAYDAVNRAAVTDEPDPDAEPDRAPRRPSGVHRGPCLPPAIIR